VPSRHLLFDVTIQKSIERHIRRTSILRLLIQLYQEAFEMLTKSLFSFVDGGVESLEFEDSFSALTDVVTKLPSKALSPFNAPDGTVLVAFRSCF